MPIRVHPEVNGRRSAAVTHHRAQLLALVRSGDREPKAAHPEAV